VTADALQHSNPPVRGSKVPDMLCGAIRGVVIYKNSFPLPAGKRCFQSSYHGCDVLSLIESGDHHCQLKRRWQGNNGGLDRKVYGGRSHHWHYSNSLLQPVALDFRVKLMTHRVQGRQQRHARHLDFISEQVPHQEADTHSMVSDWPADTFSVPKLSVLRFILPGFVLLGISLTSARSLAQPLAAGLSRSTFLYQSIGALRYVPSTLWFGRVAVGDSRSQPVTLRNDALTSVTILAVSQSAAGFTLSGLNLPLTLAPGQDVQFTVTFIPLTSGRVRESFAFTSNRPSGTLLLYLNGWGIVPAGISANPGSVAFGSVQVGKSSTQSETITNSGGSSVIISQVSIAGPGFSTAGLGAPVTLAPGRSTTIGVGFMPQSGGASCGSLTIISNGLNPTFSVSLSGTGITPGVLSASPSSTSFGAVQVGNSGNQSPTLTNTAVPP
jgi:hypothetical protein